LLKDPCLTARKIKAKLFLAASPRTIRRCIRKLGWKKIQTRYCQIVSPINRIKRFVYASMAKINNENFSDVIDVDECTKYCQIAKISQFLLLITLWRIKKITLSYLEK